MNSIDLKVEKEKLVKAFESSPQKAAMIEFAVGLLNQGLNELEKIGVRYKLVKAEDVDKVVKEVVAGVKATVTGAPKPNTGKPAA